MNRSSTIAMTMTGTIMIRTRTDIAHHCGPRVASWAATSSGIVCDLALERIERDQVLVPGEDQDDQERRDQPRRPRPAARSSGRCG